MKKIAHRGNINGPNISFENKIEYLKHAYNSGFEVECDLIAHNGILYFGHDEPIELADLEFIQSKGIWCHAKNLDALCILTKLRTHYFWHQEDNVCLTSKKFIWCYPGYYPVHKKAVWLDLLDIKLPNIDKNIYGICSDWNSYD